MQVVHIELENAPAHCVGIVSAAMCKFCSRHVFRCRAIDAVTHKMQMCHLEAPQLIHMYDFPVAYSTVTGDTMNLSLSCHCHCFKL